jgi:hypothetical protein
LQALGHGVKVIPPSYVKPYVTRQKNDTADAEAICEAMTRPTRRFEETKTAEQQNVTMLHWVRLMLVRQRTKLTNAIRAHMAKFRASRTDRASGHRGQTVKNQRRDLKASAKRHGWLIVETFDDNGVSGAKSRDERPAMRRLMEGVARKDFWNGTADDRQAPGPLTAADDGALRSSRP